MINQLQEKNQLSMLAVLGAISILGVSPFVLIRYQEANFTAMLIDVLLILGIISIVACAYFFKKIRAVSAVAAVFINTGAVVVAINNGVDGVLWVYPVCASTFILVRPIEALFINTVTGAVVVALAGVFNIVSLNSFIITSMMLSMSAYVYASHGLKQFNLLETLNTIDPLTGAFNRRSLHSGMEAALSSAERNGTQQLLAIVDLDHFKVVNDKYGHAVGDQVLRDFVAITMANIRKYDRLYRFGGEEFVLLIPEVSLQQQQACINSLRATIKSNLKTPDGKEVTVSFGVAPWLPGATADTWLKRADEALYLAKARGRDCAVFSDDSAVIV
ncbi:GGDEF domain-containing protein [Pseudomonas sp. EA_105y_Pfl2_R69]|uniref:GGDEF domain-containing protein n=1 Tax=Pseudomonas sp. EA_105y_Pfl2_R69 TaxID=3088683 RepID=UPI0030DAF30B